MFKIKNYLGIDFGTRDRVHFSNGYSCEGLKGNWQYYLKEGVLEEYFIFLDEIAKEAFREHKYVVIERINKESLSKAPFPNDDDKQTKRKEQNLKNELQGWEDIITALKREAERVGGKVIIVPSDHSSKECNFCKKISKKKQTEEDKEDIKVKRFRCWECGLDQDRDFNAAKNIQFRGMVVHIMQIMRNITPKFKCSKEEISIVKDTLNKVAKEIEEKKSYKYNGKEPVWFKIVQNSIL